MRRFKEEKGITLIALVITIIIMLILAGVTINLTLGENSIFSIAIEAREKQRISEILETLNIAEKTFIIEKIEKSENQDIKDYINLILHEEKIIIDSMDMGDGSYEVNTQDGYVFKIKEKENTNDIQIEYLGRLDKLEPVISVKNKTGTSIDIEIKRAKRSE